MILPRLAELATGAALHEGSEHTVVVLAPDRRHASTEAGAAVGALLGTDADDGRRRLAVSYPEPLILLEEEAASEAVRTLRAAGVSAFQVPAREVLHAPEAFEVEHVDVDEAGWTFRNRGGEKRSLTRDAPRFVAQGQTMVVREDRKRNEPLALVFQPSGAPLVLTPFALRTGVVNKTPPQRLQALVEELLVAPGRGATIPGCSAPTLLVQEGEGVRSNAKSLILVARLLRWQAEQDSLG